MNEKFFDLNREKQDRMINAALRIFAENGYRHASTDIIVKEAGISKGLLFHYFTSKMGLFSFLFDYSIRYMLFEYDRLISAKETDYFKIRREMERAKLNVLRSYPYMNEFIEKSLQENQLDVIETIEISKNNYLETLDRYNNQSKRSNLRDDISSAQLDNMIRYTVNGLTKDQFQAGAFQPDMLFEQICSYLDTLQTLCIR
ncbi:MAG: TetR/AcrR family transcriptional regulator [Lachnospiraceae bacterium]|nr:TetR/AcrR family transcriptional regulator [Lachnospiraceae bacterium]